MGRLTSSSSGGSVTLVNGNNVAAVNSDGSLLVVNPTATQVYNEITNVAIGMETTILSYTVLGSSALLEGISASGQNIGEIRVYKNAAVIDKQYLYYTGFNLSFIFKNIGLANGDVISVSGINNGEDICNFNAKIQIIEES